MTKKLMTYSAIIFFVACAGLLACSNSNEAQSASQKGAIEKMTDKAAQNAINRIRTPLDKARTVADQEEGRFTDMDESLNDRQ
jgi:hypothetical protein